MVIDGYGDLLQAQVDALVNPVNTVGVMGAGLALQFRAAFPRLAAEYEQVCARGHLRTGQMHVWLTGVPQPKFVVNFPTKQHWREPSTIGYINSGLKDLVAQIRIRSIESVAIPALGCGLGGLEWTQVRPRIVKAFRELPDVTVHLYPPTR